MDKYEILRLLSIETNRTIIKILNEKPMKSSKIQEKMKEKTEIKNRESIYKALERLRNNGLIKKHFDEKTGELYYSKNYRKIEVDLEDMEIEVS